MSPWNVGCYGKEWVVREDGADGRKMSLPLITKPRKGKVIPS